MSTMVAFGEEFYNGGLMLSDLPVGWFVTMIGHTGLFCTSVCFTN